VRKRNGTIRTNDRGNDCPLTATRFYENLCGRDNEMIMTSADNMQQHPHFSAEFRAKMLHALGLSEPKIRVPPPCKDTHT
jgi:hypothetical protein